MATQEERVRAAEVVGALISTLALSGGRTSVRRAAERAVALCGLDVEARRYFSGIVVGGEDMGLWVLLGGDLVLGARGREVASRGFPLPGEER